jgi:DNA-binding SARP family transcriptional activator
LVQFRVLGPVEVLLDEEVVRLPAAKPRALLALLLLSRNRVVPVAQLVDELWGERPPETATKALQGYVSQLRKVVGADRVLTKPPGYSLRVDEGELDLDRFEQLAREGRELLLDGDAGAASQRLTEALSLWRGRPFAEFDSEPFGRDAGARLEEARLAALEDRIDADLSIGRHAQLVSELEELVAQEPFRERLRAQLMLALYRSGRQAEALEAYRRTRETLVDELGIEPGEELQELERAILRHDKSLDVGPPPRRVAEEAPAQPARRRSTVVAVAAALVLAAAAAAVALALTLGSSQAHAPRKDRDVEVFVGKLEGFLSQSRDGRSEVADVIARASHCKLALRTAVTQLNRVERNRQSLLQQVAALAVPSRDETVRLADLLQQAIYQSISADGRYRDWLRGSKRCPPPSDDADLRAARRADRQATRAKRTFVAAFNPLARRFGKRAWRAGEF